MKKLAKFVGVLGLFPAMAFAQAAQGTVFGILETVLRILNTVIPILITLAIVFFVYNVVMYILAKDEDAQKEARKYMIASIIGLFVVVSVWGLVNLIGKTFGIGAGSGTNSQITVPIGACPSGQIDPNTGRCY
jgi:hypothetical protein